jgi:hypothetical protein
MVGLHHQLVGVVERPTVRPGAEPAFGAQGQEVDLDAGVQLRPGPQHPGVVGRGQQLEVGVHDRTEPGDHALDQDRGRLPPLRVQQHAEVEVGVPVGLAATDRSLHLERPDPGVGVGGGDQCSEHPAMLGQVGGQPIEPAGRVIHPRGGCYAFQPSSMDRNLALLSSIFSCWTLTV